MTMRQIADQLTRGDGNPIVRNITLIPGWTIEQFAEQLVKDGVLTDSAEFLSLCKSGTSFSEFYSVQDVLNSRNVSQRRYVLEGYLAPDTYEIYIGATASEIIRKLITQTERVFTVACEDRAEEMGYTMDEILTLASMIEKEASKADFAKVSAVFHNRLKAGMKLQSDVTIHYITGVRKMSLTGSDLALDSLYNTYQVTGLPLGRFARRARTPSTRRSTRTRRLWRKTTCISARRVPKARSCTSPAPCRSMNRRSPSTRRCGSSTTRKEALSK